MFKSSPAWFGVAAALALVTVVAGCDGGTAASSVTGKVMVNGAPVNGGSVTFAPLSADPKSNAQPAVAIVKPDGAFVLERGTVAGTHRVMYSAPSVEWESPHWDGKGAPPQPPKSPYAGLAPKQAEIEVKVGPNEVNIELAPPGTF